MVMFALMGETLTKEAATAAQALPPLLGESHNQSGVILKN